LIDAGGTVATGASGTAVGGAAEGGLSGIAGSLGGAGLTGVAAGGVVGGLVGSEVGNWVGDQIGIGGDKEQKTVGGLVGGAPTGAAVGFVAGGPVGAAVGGAIGGIIGGITGFVSDASWICTETNKVVGMTDEAIDSMNILREYALEKHSGWMRFYLTKGPKLVKAINKKEADLPDLYERIKVIMLNPVSDLIQNGKVEEAYRIYKMVAILLFHQYTPEIECEEYQEAA
jgi:hypothetical protein